MSNGSPWAQSEKDRERSSRIKARNMQMDAADHADRRSMAKAVALMRPPPYISVSGVTDANALLETFYYGTPALDVVWPEGVAFSGAPTFTSHGHLLAFGVLVSRKTLYGPGNKYPNRYPTMDAAWRGVAPYGAVTFVHYSQDTDEHLGSALIDAVNRVESSGAEVAGVQVNVHMPRRAELEAFARRYPDKRIILQLGPMIWRGQFPPETVCTALLQYGWIVTDVLLDGSAGTGKDLDLLATARYVAALDHFAPHLGIGIAGGLCEEKLTGDVERFLQVYRRLSVDAEGAIRDGAEGGGRLVYDKARRFVHRARAILDAPPVASAPSA